eukprot:Em0015g172a
MSDSKYFNTTKKGELAELKADLQSDKKDRKKEAVKKIIANMTVGKDVSSLFAEVINCMQTDNLELKKLVYLYLMNYAKSQPDLAILAVNTFAKDCDDPNPLIRALAVRTMGCIRVDKITEYLCEPLRKCLKDDDPYVRKTAAVCVAKLHDINAQLVEDQGFLDLLKELLSDSIPMVVANAVAALAEISETSASAAALTSLDTQTVNKLLTALNECTEWGQVFILDSLVAYQPKDDKEAQSICERVTPRLSHANAAVVLSAVKVLMKYMEMLPADGPVVTSLTKKLAPPLVTLLSAEPEIQFVALRNINLIVQKRPDILREDIKVFFVKYNDPIYVKLEKLEIMIRLANVNNIASVLAELKEYAAEVDVDFVRKAVRAIGRCAIKVESAAERCVSTLVELIQTKVTYVVQEGVVVIKDIFRKYPNQYESIISVLCENLDSLDEPEARASMIWILGEYCDRIDGVDEQLTPFVENFHDENVQVSAIGCGVWSPASASHCSCEALLKRPADTQQLVQKVLSLATQDSDNPDLRDRGYIYWRLLSTDPAAAKDVVLADKPTISEETDLLEPVLLNELICHISTLASVYHKPPSAFVEGKVPVRRITLQPRAEPTAAESTEDHGSDDEQGDATTNTMPAPLATGTDNLIGDLLSLDLNSGAGYAAAPVGGGGGSGRSAGSGLGDLDLLSGDLGGLQLGGGMIGGGMIGGGMAMGGMMQPPVMGGAPMGQPADQLLGFDSLMGGGSLMSVQRPQAATPSQPLVGFGGSSQAPGGMGNMDFFSLQSGISGGSSGNFFVSPKTEWLSAAKGKGLSVMGTFSARNGQMFVDMTLSNKALQPMNGFAIQFNKNSFGLVPGSQLQVAVLLPKQSLDVSLPLVPGGPVLKMQPVSMLQVAMKNNIDVFYFSAVIPMNVLFTLDGKMDRKVFLATWKEIPPTNEVQSTIENVSFTSDQIQQKLETNYIFTIAKRTVDNQDLLYMSLKFVNNIWVLGELKSTQNSTSVGIALKTNVLDVVPGVQEIIAAILHS